MTIFYRYNSMTAQRPDTHSESCLLPAGEKVWEHLNHLQERRGVAQDARQYKGALNSDNGLLGFRASDHEGHAALPCDLFLPRGIVVILMSVFWVVHIASFKRPSVRTEGTVAGDVRRWLRRTASPLCVASGTSIRSFTSQPQTVGPKSSCPGPLIHRAGWPVGKHVVVLYDVDSPSTARPGGPGDLYVAILARPTAC